MWTLSNNTKPRPAAPARDPITAWIRERLHFRPDPDQAEILAANPPRAILNCCLGWGKSTLAATRAVYEARHSPNSLILVVTPNEQTSAEFLDLVARFLSRVERPRRPENNRLLLNLRNGSRIVGLGGKRAKTSGLCGASLLLIDDAAKVYNGVYKAVKDLVAPGAATWLLSKPVCVRGFFYELWTSGGDEWFRRHIPATKCRRIPKRVVEERRRNVFPRWFRQDYLCEFAPLEEFVFDPEVIRKAFRDDIKSLVFD